MEIYSMVCVRVGSEEEGTLAPPFPGKIVFCLDSHISHVHPRTTDLDLRNEGPPTMCLHRLHHRVSGAEDNFEWEAVYCWKYRECILGGPPSKKCAVCHMTFTDPLKINPRISTFFSIVNESFCITVHGTRIHLSACLS